MALCFLLVHTFIVYIVHSECVTNYGYLSSSCGLYSGGCRNSERGVWTHSELYSRVNGLC